MTKPAGRYTYCRSKARYLSSIFQKISPYKLMRKPVVSARATRYKSLCGGEWIGGGGENICGGESASGGVGVGGFWSTMVAV